MRQHPHLPPTSPRAAGFTLVELSIVLVIIGLLVGGILAGQSLIRSAELNSVVTEYNKYTSAVTQFKTQYSGLPGDLVDATDYWGRMNLNADCVTNSSAAVSSTAGACDGNGDGLLNGASAASKSGEMFQFWRELTLAGVLEGTYTGLANTASGSDDLPGTNSPKSRANNAGWGTVYLGVTTGNTATYAYDYGNILSFGATFASWVPVNAILKPEEAWKIDTKLDDGFPGSGKIIAQSPNGWYGVSGNTTTCTTSTSLSNTPGAYNLTVNSLQCALYFAKQY